MQLNVVCTLTEEELRERRRNVLDSIRSQVIAVTRSASGYGYSFDPSSEVLAALGRLVDLERKCCPFLSFKIVVPAGGAPIQLEVSGPLEAKAAIENFFGS
jgi:hypothetical protein